MDRLSGLDLAFLHLETPHAPLHVGWLLRFEGSAPSLGALRRHVDGRLDALPRFRRRVSRPALGLGDPAWVDDPAFDVARHVHAVAAPAPGGPGELRDTACALLSQPLRSDRPLWRLYLVDGLRDGGFALAGQAHHALVDGVAAIEVAMLLFDMPGTGRPAVSRWTPAPAPAVPRAAAVAGAARLQALAAGARAAAAALASGSAPARAREVLGAAQTALRPTAPTTLELSATSQRALGFATTSLDAVRETGRRHGATVNDVVLAAAGLALGAMLRRRGEHPHAAKVLVPVDVRAGAEAAALGNRISFFAVDVPVAERDPAAVLRRVRARTRAAKAAGQAQPVDALVRAAEMLPPSAQRAVARAAARAASFTAVVSNVPGPPAELSLLGRRLTAIHPMVPVPPHHALSIGALSYRGRLHIGVAGDARVVPDALDVARDLERAFDVLALAAAPAAPPWRARAQARRAQRA